MKGGPGVRLFVATETPAVLRERLAGIQPGLRRALPSAKWTRPEGVHLTLKFLGSTRESDLPAVATAIADSAAGFSPFSLATSEPGIFESRGAPRVLWIGLEGDVDEAARLAGLLESALEPIGFAREKRPFRAHLTIARFGPGGGRPIAADLLTKIRDGLGSVSWRVETLVLFESLLSSQGSTYVPRGRFPLAGVGS